jgi:Lon protease-like protein
MGGSDRDGAADGDRADDGAADGDRGSDGEAPLAMFPLTTVLFPGAGLPLHVFEERYRALMADCMAGEGEFGVVLIARGSEVGGGDVRTDVGTVAGIVQVAEADDGRMLVMARGLRRVRVRRWLADDPYPKAVVDDLVDEPVGAPVGAPIDGATGTPAHPGAGAEQAVRRLRSLLSELGQVPALPHDLVLTGRDDEVGWHLCELAPLNLMDRQQLLSSPSHAERMSLLSELCAAMSDDVARMLGGGLTDS